MTTMNRTAGPCSGRQGRAVRVRCGGLQLSYSQMWERAGRVVGALHGLGVGAGDRVAVVGPNCHRYLELYQAVPGAGMVLVPLNQRHTAAELGYALEDSGAKVLFAASGIDYPDGLVEHAFDMGDGYEQLIADAAPSAFSDELSCDISAGLAPAP
jgi:long-chain acyl-CoA synthetase